MLETNLMTLIGMFFFNNARFPSSSEILIRD